MLNNTKLCVKNIAEIKFNIREMNNNIANATGMRKYTKFMAKKYAEQIIPVTFKKIKKILFYCN